jgi:hypothetical protein
MEFHCRTELTAEQSRNWTEFLDRSPHAHPRQDLRYGAVEARMGNTPLYFTATEKGVLRGICLVSLQRRSASGLPIVEGNARGGPVCDDPDLLIEFLEAICRHPALESAVTLKSSPYWLDDDARALAPRFATLPYRHVDPAPFRDTGLIDLDRTEEEIQSSFSRSARRKVRLAEKAGIEVRPIRTLDDAHVFFDRLNRMLARHKLTPTTRLEYENSFDTILTDSSIGIILGAYSGDRFLGGYLSLRSRRVAHSRSYVADVEAIEAIDGPRIAPLVWLTGLLWAKAEGCRVVDVEGWKHVSDPSEPQFNVYEYKGEFNPTPAIRISEQLRILRPGLHRIAKASRKVRTALERGLARVSRRRRAS